MDKVIAIATDCLERVWPDLSIVLDVDLETASRRLNRDLDRMEQKGEGYHQRVRKGFLELAQKQKNFFVIDAAKEINSVHERVIDIIEKTF